MLQLSDNHRKIQEHKVKTSKLPSLYYEVFGTSSGRKVLGDILEKSGLFGEKRKNETAEEFLSRRSLGKSIYQLYLEGEERHE